MCFDAKTSFSTGIFTVITCLLLLGDKGTKYALDTKKIAYTFIYISLVQFLEGFMWLDQGCHLGYNKISTTLIHYIVYLQPTIVYLIGRSGQKSQKGTARKGKRRQKGSELFGIVREQRGHKESEFPRI